MVNATKLYQCHICREDIAPTGDEGSRLWAAHIDNHFADGEYSAADFRRLNAYSVETHTYECVMTRGGMLATMRVRCERRHLQAKLRVWIADIDLRTSYGDGRLWYVGDRADIWVTPVD